MTTEKNPLGFKLTKIQERSTGNFDLALEEADGGNIYCPYPSYEKGAPQMRTCSSNCAFFFTKCNIPGSLGLEVPKE